MIAGLPAGEPVFYAPSIDYYVVSRHADIAEVFHDTDTCSAASAQLPLVSLDGAEHDRLRRPATRSFTVKRVNEWSNTRAGLSWGRPQPAEQVEDKHTQRADDHTSDLLAIH